MKQKCQTAQKKNGLSTENSPNTVHGISFCTSYTTISAIDTYPDVLHCSTHSTLQRLRISGPNFVSTATAHPESNHFDASRIVPIA